MTTQGPPPIDLAAATASSTLNAAPPRGTATPNPLNNSFAWYSWTFMRSLFRTAAGRRPARTRAWARAPDRRSRGYITAWMPNPANPLSAKFFRNMSRSRVAAAS